MSDLEPEHFIDHTDRMADLAIEDDSLAQFAVVTPCESCAGTGSKGYHHAFGIRVTTCDDCYGTGRI